MIIFIGIVVGVLWFANMYWLLTNMSKTTKSVRKYITSCTEKPSRFFIFVLYSNALELDNLKGTDIFGEYKKFSTPAKFSSIFYLKHHLTKDYDNYCKYTIESLPLALAAFFLLPVSFIMGPFSFICDIITTQCIDINAYNKNISKTNNDMIRNLY